LSPPGEHGPTTVPVISPLAAVAAGRGESVTLNPASVTVKVTVQQTSGEKTIESMPVWVELQPSLSDEVRVSSEEWVVKGIHVRGPKEEIAKIDDTYLPHATLTIARDDVRTNVPQQKKLWFDNGS